MFLKAFEGSGLLRQAASVHQTALRQVAGDPNHVYMVVECDTLVQLRAFCISNELEQAMQLAGVITPPQVQFFDNVRYYPN